MPIYEYACDKCQAKQEVLQKFDEAAPEICPSCGAKGTLHKAVSGSTFHLKGGGWYKDLYSSKKSSDSSSSTSGKSSDKPTKKD